MLPCRLATKSDKFNHQPPLFSGPHKYLSSILVSRYNNKSNHCNNLKSNRRNLMSTKKKSSKRPRLQTTAASDITPSTGNQFIHSSNTSTCTRQIVTTSNLTVPSSSVMDIDTNFPDLFPVTNNSEQDHPAGIEIVKKPQRNVNSV